MPLALPANWSPPPQQPRQVHFDAQAADAVIHACEAMRAMVMVLADEHRSAAGLAASQWNGPHHDRFKATLGQWHDIADMLERWLEWVRTMVAAAAVRAVQRQAAIDEAWRQEQLGDG